MRLASSYVASQMVDTAAMNSPFLVALYQSDWVWPECSMCVVICDTVLSEEPVLLAVVTAHFRDMVGVTCSILPASAHARFMYLAQ